MFLIHRPPGGPVQAPALRVHFPDGVLDLRVRNDSLACLCLAPEGQQMPAGGAEPAVLHTIALRNGGANDLRLGLAVFRHGRREAPAQGDLRLQAEGLDAAPRAWGVAQVSVRLGDVAVECLHAPGQGELGLFIRQEPGAALASGVRRFVVHPCGANCFSIGVQ